MTTAQQSQSNSAPASLLNDWVHVFSGGEQTASSGATVNLSDDQLDDIIARTQSHGVVPHVITHDELYSPFRFGESDQFKREGSKIFAKQNFVSPQLHTLVGHRYLPDRSIELRRDGDGYRIGHIAWLGAEPPAVEDLESVSFSAASDDVLQFSVADDVRYQSGLLARLFRKLRDRFIDKDGLDEADGLISEFDIEQLSELSREREMVEFVAPAVSNPPMEVIVTTYTQEQLDDAVANATAPLQQQINDQQREQRRERFSAFVDDAITTKRITPAQAEGLTDLCAHLADTDTVLQFSAAGSVVKKSPVDVLQNFISSLPVQADKRLDDDTDTVDLGDANALAESALRYQRERKEAGVTISVSQAMQHVTGDAK